MASAENIAEQIDREVDYLHQCRSVFPRLDKSMVGRKEFQAPEYYRGLGYSTVVKLSEPMTAAFIDNMFELGNWLNESFIVRLHGVMEANGLIGKTTGIDQVCDGWEEVDLMRRLRREIAHGSSGYDKDDPKKVKLYERIVDHFQLPNDYSYLEVEKYPIGVGSVLVPMSEGCKRYAAAAIPTT